ncbi:MAG: hypothetical protein ACKV2T_17255 [Kofleriaceae bacterium]
MPRVEVWIAGFPSRYGGADTELDHQIDLLRRFDVDVHLVPMTSTDDAMMESVVARGCHVHPYRNDVFAGRTVLSWCNGTFLDRLPRIMHAGRPARVVWFNCMTWLFDRERDAHARGWIDVFGFVSRYQRDLLMPELTRIGPVRTFDYRPFFNLDRVESEYRPWGGSYQVGRISRDDPAKFAPDTWHIFDAIRVPRELAKRVVVVGLGADATTRIGPPPPALDVEIWPPDTLPADCFFAEVDTLVHKTGGSRESYCRAVIEAYAHAVVPVVEADYAFPELIMHGETGFMARTSGEMIDYASMLAHEPALHRRIARQGREHLANLSRPERCWAGWNQILRSGESRHAERDRVARRRSQTGVEVLAVDDLHIPLVATGLDAQRGPADSDALDGEREAESWPLRIGDVLG